MRSLFLLFTLASVLTGSSVAHAQQTLTFREPTPGPTVNYITAVLEEAYADMGISLTYMPLPRLRGEQLAQSGQIAGELGRQAGIETTLDNLIRVPFKLYEFSIVLVARHETCGLCTLKEVNNIAYVGGMRAAEAALQEANYSGTTFQQNNIHQIARLLKAKRIDAALVADFQLRNLDLDNPQAYVVYTVRKENGYHYLHQSYQHLVEPLHQRLALMQASGRLAQLQRQHLKRLPSQLQPITMPTELLATAAVQPSLTEANGNGKLWQLIRNAYSNAVDRVDVMASNWPRAINAVLEGSAQLLVGVREGQFKQDLLYTEQPIAMDEPVYVFAANEAKLAQLIAGNSTTTVCYSDGNEQRQLLPETLAFYHANTSLDCFALLDLNRVDGVIDYQHNLPDWMAKPYRRERLRNPTPLYAAFAPSPLGSRLKAHLDRSLKSQLTPRLVRKDGDTVR